MPNTVSKAYTDLQPEEWNNLPVLAQRIRVLLEKNNMTANQLSKKTNIRPSVIKAYIESKNDIGICNLQKLADAFCVTTDYLLGRSDLPTENPTAEAASKYTGISPAACQRLHEIYTCAEHFALSAYGTSDFRIDGDWLVVGKIFVDGEPVTTDEENKDRIQIKDVTLPLGHALEYSLLREDFSFISSMILQDNFIELASFVRRYKQCLKKATEYLAKYLSMEHDDSLKRKEPFGIEKLHSIYYEAQTESRDARIQMLDIQETIKDIVNTYASDIIQQFREKCKEAKMDFNI